MLHPNSKYHIYLYNHLNNKLKYKPKMTYGAIVALVPRYECNIAFVLCYLAKPKSAIFRTPLRIKIFSGLTSRWIIYLVLKYLNPFNISPNLYLISGSVISLFSLINSDSDYFIQMMNYFFITKFHNHINHILQFFNII